MWNEIQFTNTEAKNPWKNSYTSLKQTLVIAHAHHKDPVTTGKSWQPIELRSNQCYGDLFGWLGLNYFLAQCTISKSLHLGLIKEGCGIPFFKFFGHHVICCVSSITLIKVSFVLAFVLLFYDNINWWACGGIKDQGSQGRADKYLHKYRLGNGCVSTTRWNTLGSACVCACMYVRVCAWYPTRQYL